MKNIGFGTSAAQLALVHPMSQRHLPYPLDMLRFITTTSLLFHACSTGIPEIGESGSRAIGLTVSLAPMTRVTSVSGKSSFISSISSTTILVSLAEVLGCCTYYRKEPTPPPEAHCIDLASCLQQDEWRIARKHLWHVAYARSQPGHTAPSLQPCHIQQPIPH